MKNIFIKLFLFILLATNAFSQDRNIVWMHGNGNNAANWANTPQLFSNSHRINSIVNSYPTQQGVAVYANATRAAQNFTSIGNNGIMIGQSMGGLVARHILITNPTFAGGMISLGSPLSGAHIAQNLGNGQVQQAITHAFNQIKAGPQSELFDINTSLLTYAGAQITVNIIMDRVWRNVYNNQIDQAITPSYADMMPTSQYMNTTAIPGVQTRPHLAIWGNENAPVVINHAAAFAGIPKAQMRDWHQAVINFYEFKQVQNLAQGIIFGPFLGAINFYQSEQYRKGKLYLKDGAEADWNRLIGAFRTDSRQECHQVLECTWECYFDYCDQAPVAYSEFNSPELIEGNCQYKTYCVTNLVQVNEPSDGFISATSQRGTPLNRRPTSVVEARGVSHPEFYTSEISRNILRNAFNGANGEFFQTAIR